MSPRQALWRSGSLGQGNTEGLADRIVSIRKGQAYEDTGTVGTG